MTTFDEMARKAQEALGPPQDPRVQSLLQDATVHAVLAWRSDSIMLARCRLIFMDLMADALAVQCANAPLYGVECLVDEGRAREEWCSPCRLHDLADRVRAVTKP